MQQILNLLQSGNGQASLGQDATGRVSDSGQSDGMDFGAIISKTNGYGDAQAEVRSRSGSGRSEHTAVGESQRSDTSQHDGETVLSQIDKARQLLTGAGRGGETLPPPGSEDTLSVLTGEPSTFMLFSDLLAASDEDVGAELRGQLAELLGVDEAALDTLDEASLQTMMLLQDGLESALRQLATAQSVRTEAIADEANMASPLELVLPGSTNTTSAGATVATQTTQVPQITQAAQTNLSRLEALQAGGHSQRTDASQVTEGAQGAGDTLADDVLTVIEGDDSAIGGNITQDKFISADTLQGRALGQKGDEGVRQTQAQAASAQVGTAQVVSSQQVATSESPAGSAVLLSEMSIMAPPQLTKGQIEVDTLSIAEEPLTGAGELSANHKSADKAQAIDMLVRSMTDGTQQTVGASERPTVEAPRHESVVQHGLEPRLHAQRTEPMAVTLSLRQVAERPSTADMVARFAPVMNSQLIAMVRDGIQQAEVRLDPPELGSMMVRIQVQGNETQVQFHVSASQTKDVVEQAMPRLRELLAQQGMELTDGQVSHQRRERQEGGDSHERQQSDSAMDEIQAEELQLSVNQTTSYVSGIDYYA